MKLTALLLMALLTATCAKAQHPLRVDCSGSMKIATSNANPVLDHLYVADPTAVEYEGRLYVYGTNDQQQCDETHPDSANSYERINSLAMMSTDDMVNWTYHGLIPTKQLSPWIIASWAPSVCSRLENDGKTHFYLYYSNSGYGTGVLTATSPVGPWSSPLDRSIVDADTPGLGDCRVPFDPGVVIDEEGVGWLTFGAGKARIARLAPDMLSFSSPFAVIPAAHHFEANELNVIGGKLVYTYNTDWTEKEDWTLSADKPTRCSMAYMIPDNPLDSTSWHYKDYYLKNPGDYGFEYCNNHTHLHKYADKWYLLYHTMSLKTHRGIKGGYRSICVEEIDIDEANAGIPMTTATHKGPKQIRPLCPYVTQQIETTAGTMNVKFQPSGTDGNMYAAADGVGVIVVRGARFDKKVKSFIVKTKGKGQIDVRLDTPDGPLLSTMQVVSAGFDYHSSKLLSRPQGDHDVCIMFSGEDLLVDEWRMK